MITLYLLVKSTLMVFDIKSELTCNTCFITGAHLMDTPKQSTYCSIVSCNSVHIALMIAAYNDLDLLSANIQNAYINSPTEEKSVSLWA